MRYLKSASRVSFTACGYVPHRLPQFVGPDAQKTVVLPQARRDWGQLRFLDFKSVEAYNSALHRIVGQLSFCGQRVTDAEMIEKTLEIFHPSNIVLQQQYRNNRYRKYSELITVCLVEGWGEVGWVGPVPTAIWMESEVGWVGPRSEYSREMRVGSVR